MPLIAGRASFGAFAAIAAVPLCRLADLTTDASSARRLGRAIAIVDITSLLPALIATTPKARRRAAITNAVTDGFMAGVLATLAGRRQGRPRVINALAAASVAAGALAWGKAAAKF